MKPQNGARLHISFFIRRPIFRISFANQGEHCTIDVLLGWAYAVAAFQLVTKIVSARSAGARRSRLARPVSDNAPG